MKTGTNMASFPLRRHSLSHMLQYSSIRCKSSVLFFVVLSVFLSWEALITCFANLIFRTKAFIVGFGCVFRSFSLSILPKMCQEKWIRTFQISIDACSCFVMRRKCLSIPFAVLVLSSLWSSSSSYQFMSELWQRRIHSFLAFSTFLFDQHQKSWSQIHFHSLGGLQSKKSVQLILFTLRA